MLKNMIVYPVNDVFLGKLDTLHGDEIKTEVWAFYRETDKTTKSVNFRPLRNLTQYYYIQELTPIKTILNKTDISMWITQQKIARVVAKENKAIQLESLVDKPKIKLIEAT